MKVDLWKIGNLENHLKPDFLEMNKQDGNKNNDDNKWVTE